MWLDVRVDSMEPPETTMVVVATAVIPSHLIVDGLEWLDEDTGGKESGVDDCQRLQQPVGGAVLVVTPITSQHGHRQSIADPPDHTQSADKVDVDDQSVRRHRRVTG